MNGGGSTLKGDLARVHLSLGAELLAVEVEAGALKVAREQRVGHTEIEILLGLARDLVADIARLLFDAFGAALGVVLGVAVFFGAACGFFGGYVSGTSGNLAQCGAA